MARSDSVEPNRWQFLWRWLPQPSGGAVAAFLLGAATWQLYSYWRRLLGRVPLILLPAHLRVEAHLSPEEKAAQIASADLRAGIESRYLPNGERRLVMCAGMRHFREPWARDFGFASFGLAELNEVQVLKETLEIFLLNQTAAGQFPVKVHSTNILDRYLHSLFRRQQPIDAPLRPKYVTAHNTVSLDGSALLVIAALNYLRRFDDETFCHTHWSAFKRALIWLERQALAQDGLLHQGPYTDWADSVARVGCVFYTNVLYWKATHEFAQDAAKYGYGQDYAYFSAKADQLRQTINLRFWRADLGYFVTNEQFDLLSSDGNLLAVAWRLATPEQSHAVLDRMRDAAMASPVPTQVTDRSYGSRYIALENRLAGVPHYHTFAAWLWLGAWHVVALSRMGRLEEARELLARIDALIVRDGVVHEVYDQDGRVLSTFWYTSEAPLTWSARMLIHARSVYQRALATSAAPPPPHDGMPAHVGEEARKRRR